MARTLNTTRVPEAADAARRLVQIPLAAIAAISGNSIHHINEILHRKRPPSPGFLLAWSKLRITPRAILEAARIIEEFGDGQSGR